MEPIKNPQDNIKNFLYKKIESVKIPQAQSFKRDFNRIKSHFTLIDSFRVTLLLIGFGAMYMSIFYSYEWLSNFLSPWRAFLLSSIMVIFAVGAFELIILFRQRKQWALVTIFIFLWVIVTIFSMVSTVAGQYNVRIKDLSLRYQTENLNEEKKDVNEQKTEYQETLAGLKKDAIYYQGLLGKYLTKDDIQNDRNNYETLSWNYRRIQNKIEILQAKLEGLRKEKTGSKFTNKTPPDFYLWISMLWGFKPDMVQFWMSIFPAIFIDLVAPISVAVFMFVRK